MRRVWRWIGVLAVVLLFATAAGAALPRFAIELLAPHTPKRSAAVLDKALETAIDSALEKSTLATVEEAMDFSLSASDKLLHFGLEHATSMAFSATEREGNCIEYAHLFARVFDKAAQKAGLGARAFPVHSAGARIFGRQVPLRGWEDHDWVLIQVGSGEGARRWYVDPTMHDAGLGWDISANVRGPVTAEIKAPPKEPKPERGLPQASKKSAKPAR
jgi:hypothetical protein